MIPVMQTITGKRGNCLSAVFASLMELELNEVPYFFENIKEGDEDVRKALHTFNRDVKNFLYSKGYFFLELEPSNLEEIIPQMRGFFIVGGKSPRSYNHAVIYTSEGLAHDPHPEGGGVIPETLMLLYPLFNYAQIKNQPDTLWED